MATHEIEPVAPVSEIDMEVVSGSATSGNQEQKAKASGWIAWAMDEVISIPGTNVKIGLDPIMGLLPGGGDFASGAVGCISLIEAMRRGIPMGAMWKITGNILVNAGFGSVPIIGDIFSLMFRSNSRNRDLINEHLQQAIAEGREASWWRVLPFVLVIIGVVLGAIVLNITLWSLLLAFVASGVSGVVEALSGSAQ